MLKVFTCLLLLFVASPVWAQDAPELAGKNELGVSGKFDFQGPNGDNIDLRIGYGWFLRDDLLLGASFEWALSEDIAPGEDDYRAQQAGVELQYLFPGDGPWMPYVGLEAGFRNLKFEDDDDSGLVLGANAGVRYLLTQSVAVDFNLRWLTASKDLFIVDFDAEKQYVVPVVGIKAIF